ncbi:hypothetical protein RvVAR0630_pl04230 (plasmid) [Agrobacterium vitis]|nr:hypothetical protein RvVAR0630_pl04230 [Agrobacterium vitis]
MGDKGYDSEANRQAARRRGAVPVIPYRSTAKSKPTFFPKALYKGHARIEQAVGKLKRFKRVALRCEKGVVTLSFPCREWVEVLGFSGDASRNFPCVESFEAMVANCLCGSAAGWN